MGPAKTERWKHKRMKRFYKKAVSLLMAAVLCTGIFSGCEALDTTLPDEEETQEAIETRKAQANPQKALEQIYSDLGKRIGLVEPTEEQLESVVGLNLCALCGNGLWCR